MLVTASQLGSGLHKKYSAQRLPANAPFSGMLFFYATLSVVAFGL